jgi:hypothetical protein
MDTEMEIDPEIAAMMGFGSFGGNKKRKFGADDAFTDAQPANAQRQEPQQVVSNANAVPVAEARSRPINPPVAGELTQPAFELCHIRLLTYIQKIHATISLWQMDRR